MPDRRVALIGGNESIKATARDDNRRGLMRLMMPRRSRAALVLLVCGDESMANIHQRRALHEICGDGRDAMAC